MPDMRSAMGSAGFRDRGRRGKPRNERERFKFPDGYPDYFSDAGVLREEYVGRLADHLAVALGRDKLTKSQLRAFYGYVKRREAALRSGKDPDQVILEIKKLRSQAHARAADHKIPELFQEFLQRNVDAVRDKHTFLDGFVEHFQAVVAYCAGRVKKD